MSETINYKKLLRSAVDNDLISIADYNAGIYCYLVYRIVWETKAHYILFPFPTEEEAIKYINGREGYYYQRLKL